MSYNKIDNLKVYVFSQRMELTHSNVYYRLSNRIKNTENKATLMSLSNRKKKIMKYGNVIRQSTFNHLRFKNYFII